MDDVKSTPPAAAHSSTESAGTPVTVFTASTSPTDDSTGRFYDAGQTYLYVPLNAPDSKQSLSSSASSYDQTQNTSSGSAFRSVSVPPPNNQEQTTTEHSPTRARATSIRVQDMGDSIAKLLDKLKNAGIKVSEEDQQVLSGFVSVKELALAYDSLERGDDADTIYQALLDAAKAKQKKPDTATVRSVGEDQSSDNNNSSVEKTETKKEPEKGDSKENLDLFEIPEPVPSPSHTPSPQPPNPPSPSSSSHSSDTKAKEYSDKEEDTKQEKKSEGRKRSGTWLVPPGNASASLNSTTSNDHQFDLPTNLNLPELTFTATRYRAALTPSSQTKGTTVGYSSVVAQAGATVAPNRDSTSTSTTNESTLPPTTTTTAAAAPPPAGSGSGVTTTTSSTTTKVNISQEVTILGPSSSSSSSDGGTPNNNNDNNNSTKQADMVSLSNVTHGVSGGGRFGPRVNPSSPHSPSSNSTKVRLSPPRPHSPQAVHHHFHIPLSSPPPTSFLNIKGALPRDAVAQLVLRREDLNQKKEKYTRGNGTSKPMSTPPHYKQQPPPPTFHTTPPRTSYRPYSPRIRQVARSHVTFSTPTTHNNDSSQHHHHFYDPNPSPTNTSTSWFGNSPGGIGGNPYPPGGIRGDTVMDYVCGADWERPRLRSSSPDYHISPRRLLTPSPHRSTPSPHRSGLWDGGLYWEESTHTVRSATYL